MVRARNPLLVAAVLLLPHASGAGTLPSPLSEPAPVPEKRPEASLPVGTWRIEYANEVTEVCDIRKDGTATVVEPVRIGGKAVANGSAVIVLFDNGRVQRWTPVGKRLVVEHWFPGSGFPTASPGVLGIAERTQ